MSTVCVSRRWTCRGDGPPRPLLRFLVARGRAVSQHLLALTLRRPRLDAVWSNLCGFVFFNVYWAPKIAFSPLAATNVYLCSVSACESTVQKGEVTRGSERAEVACAPQQTWSDDASTSPLCLVRRPTSDASRSTSGPAEPSADGRTSRTRASPKVCPGRHDNPKRRLLREHSCG